MPDLLSRAITLQPFRQLAVPSQTISRLHIRRSHGTAAARDQSLPVNSLHHSQPTVNDDGQPLRLRKHGFKSLPLSPLMRTEKDAAPATTRRAPPPPPPADEAMEAFQKEVALNPYARALATPVRYCSVTLAHLPSHYLLPFTTLLETTPSSDHATQPPQVKVRLQPGRRSDHPSRQTLAQTSYVINRQDAVRHLSRKRHWTFLVLERQKARVASLARRSSSSQKLVHDLWVWEGQVDGMAAYLEGRVVEEAKRASRAATKAEHDASSSGEQVSGLEFVAVDPNDEDIAAGSSRGETDDAAMYDLTTLLSPEGQDSITSHAAAQDVTGKGVWKVKGSHDALHFWLAMEKLRSYKESNEIQKALPMVQNPVGSREARLQRLSELGARSWSEEERKDS